MHAHLHRKTPGAVHRRDPSDELDVFEAARYLSGSADATTIGFGGKTLREDGQQRYLGRSEQHQYLGKPEPVQQPDNHPRRSQLIADEMMARKKKTSKKKQHNPKQPVSPGSRLATFLTYLFHQKKTKPPLSKTTINQDDDHSSDIGRRRRSSIDVVRATEPMSMCSCRSTGFRTPPHKVDPDGGHNCKISSSRSTASYPTSTPESGFGPWERGRASMGSRVHDKELLEKDVVSCGAEKKWTLVSKNGRSLVVDGFTNDSRSSSHLKGMDQLRRGEEVEEEEEDNGGKSDSSSDLFELPNYDLPVPAWRR